VDSKIFGELKPMVDCLNDLASTAHMNICPATTVMEVASDELVLPRNRLEPAFDISGTLQDAFHSVEYSRRSGGVRELI
jgi:hypothetical protein